MNLAAAAAPKLSPRRRHGRALSGLLLIACAPLLFVGCGTDVYEQRLIRTQHLFEYHNTLNQNLQGVWNRQDLGLSMRIPKGFQQLPAPPAPKELEDGSLEVVEDTRHPSYLGIELPGLVDAWQLPNAGSLYICTNHSRFLDQATGAAAAEPAAFLGDLEATLQQGLNFAVSPEQARTPGEPNARFPERIPPPAVGDNQFAAPKDFTTIDIAPGEIENVPPLSANLYETASGPIQVAIVLIYLKSAPQDLSSPLRLGLETLQVSDQLPKAAAGAAGSAGGAPARSGSVGF